MFNGHRNFSDATHLTDPSYRPSSLQSDWLALFIMSNGNLRDFLIQTIALATDTLLNLLAYPLLNCSIAYSLPPPFLSAVRAIQVCMCWGFNTTRWANLTMVEIWMSSSKATYSFPILNAPKSKYILTPFCLSKSRPGMIFLLRFFTTIKSWEWTDFLFGPASERGHLPVMGTHSQSLISCLSFAVQVSVEKTHKSYNIWPIPLPPYLPRPYTFYLLF